MKTSLIMCRTLESRNRLMDRFIKILKNRNINFRINKEKHKINCGEEEIIFILSEQELVGRRNEEVFYEEQFN
mgnify:FL=1